jgi:hypothetical protein
VKNNSGLSVDGIGMLPGEILMVNAQSDRPIEVITPKEFPSQMLQVPQTLLGLQKELQGFTQSRQGQPGQGNTSAELYDASIYQSQPQTRMRARLLSESLQRLAQIVFYVSSRYQSMPHRMPDVERGETIQREWEPISPDAMHDYDAQLDEGSLQVLSATALRSVVAALAKSGAIPTKMLLETYGVPDAATISEEATREAELRALGKLKRPR